EMIRQKTAVLLGFSLEFGALLAQAPASDQKALRNFGVDIGIGFQLKDDWLDVFGDGKKFGKQVGGDIIANKKTYLMITALSQASGNNRKELNRWISAPLFDKRKKVQAVTAIYERLGVSNHTEKKIDFYFKRGLAQLEKLNVQEIKKAALREYVLNLINRIS
ncbi:MAG: polyprenyl synthetase family protein, partial [Cyclobacteriaceae bacterium]